MSERQVLVEKNVSCQLRDGTMLKADVYRPNDGGAYPVLMTRLPYSKDLPRYSQTLLDPIKAAGRGYVVIIQDVRGRFQSEGTFRSYLSEAEDGYDAVEWAASLPYSTGDVGMYGISYFGFTQLLAAGKQPPHLKAIFPMMTFNDSRDGVVYHGGAMNLGLTESWALGTIAPDLLVRKHGMTPELGAALQQYAGYVNHIEDWYRDTPVKEWTPLKELGTADFFFEQSAHPLEDEAYWEETSIVHQYGQLGVPAFHLAGWYDVFLGPTIKNYTEMAKKTGQKQKLIIGPWGHGTFTPVVGERSFGIHSSGEFINLKEDLTSLQLRWFDHTLKGEDNHIDEEPPVKLFVMGINQWRDEKEWPLQRTEYIPYYFHSKGNANSRNGDGGLSREIPNEQRADTYIYDPENPVPTKGGGTLYAGVLTMGPRDQGEIEDRGDVLVYTSEPLEQPLEVTGPVKVKLWAVTDAVDTDFTAKLVDVMPDGTPYNLTDGIVRAKYRNGYQPEPVQPGDIVEYEIDLWATSNVFLPGHRIRVEVSSSNFPRFDRNPNTGKTMVDSSETQPARQKVFHNADYPSHIILPVIPGQ
ncbi:MAG TPA: CocE/NonD family hydrolase [Bacillales bacterium]|nr:CocE/NonD family hydrolase [Bacillales bacterium]